MQVESHERLGAPERKKATRVVVYDDHNNPVAVFLQVTPTNIFAKFKGQPGFEQALLNLGIRDTSIVTIVDPKNLPELKVE